MKRWAGGGGGGETENYINCLLDSLIRFLYSLQQSPKKKKTPSATAAVILFVCVVCLGRQSRVLPQKQTNEK